MSRYSRAPRKVHRDAGEPEHIAALEGVGATVQPLDIPGGPDLLVGWRGVNTLLEIKGAIGPKGGTSGRGQRLNERQVKWHRGWKGQVTVTRSPRESLMAIGAIKP